MHEALLLAHADDLVLLCNSAVDVKKKRKILSQCCKIRNLEINTEKTKKLAFHEGKKKYYYKIPLQ